MTNRDGAAIHVATLAIHIATLAIFAADLAALAAILAAFAALTRPSNPANRLEFSPQEENTLDTK